MDALTKARLARSRDHRMRLTTAGRTGYAPMQSRPTHRKTDPFLRELSDLGDTKAQRKSMSPVRAK